jgi:hypothetical protein
MWNDGADHIASLEAKVSPYVAADAVWKSSSTSRGCAVSSAHPTFSQKVLIDIRTAVVVPEVAVSVPTSQ